MKTLQITKRGNVWQYRFEIANENGKRKYISRSGFKTKGEAIKEGTKAQNEYNNIGSIVNTSKIDNLSVTDYLYYWLDEYCVTNLKATTVEGYRKKIKNLIVPYIGMYRLNNISPIVLQQYINDRFNDGFSRNTLLSLKGILSKSFRYAIQPLQILNNNPMLYVELPSVNAISKKKSRKKERYVISPDDFKTIINRFPYGSSQYLPLILAYNCGLRLGETFALDINDFNEDAKTITINNQIQCNTNNEWYYSLPKYKSKRVIDLDDETFKLLQKIKLQQKKDKLFYGKYYVHLYKNSKGVLSTERSEDSIEVHPFSRRECGEYIQPRVMQHCGRIVHYELNMPNWDYHSLRHTHTTNLLVAGADIKYVQVRLGHKNVETTLNIYTHLTDEMINKNNNILNSISVNE